MGLFPSDNPLVIGGSPFLDSVLNTASTAEEMRRIEAYEMKRRHFEQLIRQAKTTHIFMYSVLNLLVGAIMTVMFSK